ncbi:MAG: GntR family transcriptional regulator [Eubacterium sp.]|nr:GntR family transcriptional regulator [Eubacterium sp.]
MAISTDLFSTLKDEILQGKLLSGQKLTEKVICEKYQISRTPVREALHKLEMEGLVESIPNRGFFVLGLTDQDYMDMFTLRKVYEVQATQWAIQRITKEELEELEELFEFMEFYTMKKDIAKMLTINMNFHQKIYAASHNRMLKNLLSSYQEMLKHRENPVVKSDSYLIEVFSEHKAIFEAFKNRDVEAGMAAMSIHMDNSMARYTSRNK